MEKAIKQAEEAQKAEEAKKAEAELQALAQTEEQQPATTEGEGEGGEIKTDVAKPEQKKKVKKQAPKKEPV